MDTRVELVLPGSPVLTPSFLRECVGQFDADLVAYIGIAEVSARPDSFAFAVDQAAVYVRQAADAGVRVFAAMNAEIDDRRMGVLPDTASRLFDAGVEAFIVSDVAAISQLCQRGLPVHVSSLMPVYNTESLKRFRDMGASRVVLPTSLWWHQIEPLAHSRIIELELIASGGVCFNDCTRCGLDHDMDDRGLIVACKQSVAEDGAVRPIWLPHADPTRIAPRAVAAGIRSLKVEGRSESRAIVSTRIRDLVSSLSTVPFEGDPQKGRGLYEY